MAPAIPNGGGGEDIGTGDLIPYDSSINKPPGEQTPEERGVIDDLEARAGELAAGWTNTPSVDPMEVLRRAARLQGNIGATVRQYARAGSERRMLEMISSLTQELTRRDRELLELRARLDASPY